MSSSSDRRRPNRDLIQRLQGLGHPDACATSGQQLEEIMLEWLRRAKL